MKNTLLAIVLVSIGMVVGTGCSTMGKFKIPQDTKLMVTDRVVTPDANGEWKTSPFFWSSTGGADYRLLDKNGKIIRTGKIKTKFRVVSIFWPPAAIVYWPMGMADGEFDMTTPGDGYHVTDTMAQNSSSVYTPAASTPTAPAAKAKKKKAKAEAAPATN